jgi:hypothetical protein
MFVESKLSRLSKIFLVLAVPPFFCGGLARTLYQYGGPLWLNTVGDIMFGITMFFISSFGISFAVNKAREQSHHIAYTLSLGLIIAICALGTVIGLLITVTRMLDLLGFLR